ncbi:inorganic phosphate transporter, partial [Patescibacteria group bacterium]|nr:inorganic phosphate transporter [Patescibacteria group bacterium]
FFYKLIVAITPKRSRAWIASRWERNETHAEHKHSFDLLRAAVNLMVAAAVISYATSYKLPLSTTYVTFMAAMGSSLADGAWSSESAPSRIAGVLAVVSGWFLTAILIFVLAGVAVSVLYLLKLPGLVILMITIVLIVYKLFHVHNKRLYKINLVD